MQKAKQTTMSELAGRADYVAPQVVCHSIEIEGVLASSSRPERPGMELEGTRPTDPNASSGNGGWNIILPEKPYEFEDLNN